MKENGFTLKKQWYTTETLTKTDYSDDIALLANTPTQGESLLRSLRAGNRRHWPSHERKQNEVHVF